MERTGGILGFSKEMVSNIRLTVAVETLHIFATEVMDLVSCSASAMNAVNLEVRWKYLGKDSHY